MNEWIVKANKNYSIFGETLQEACNNSVRQLVTREKPDKELIVSLPKGVGLRYEDGIFGGTGGIVADIECRVSTAYTKDSEFYEEFDKIYHVWIHAQKEDLENDLESVESIRQLRKKTKMSQPDFGKKYGIPVATIRDWEQGRRKCPDYVVELIKFKVNSDFEVSDN